MITLIHKKDEHRFYKMGFELVCVHRPSKLGNPYKVSTRLNNIENYRDYLEHNEDLLHEVYEIAVYGLNNDVALVCFCAPKTCHGDVILDLISTIWDVPYSRILRPKSSKIIGFKEFLARIKLWDSLKITRYYY